MGPVRNFKIPISAAGPQGCARVNVPVLTPFLFGDPIQKLAGSQVLC